MIVAPRFGVGCRFAHVRTEQVMGDTAMRLEVVCGLARLAAPWLVTLGLVGCATSGISSGVNGGSPVVVRPLDDPAAVTRALARVQTDLDTVERRLEELEQRSRGGVGDAAPAPPREP